MLTYGDVWLMKMSVLAGPDNSPPLLHMWPAPIPQSADAASPGTNSAFRQVPAGQEGGIYGLYLSDSDAFGGLLTVTITAQLGVVSLHGLGPWQRAAASQAAFNANIEDGAAEAIRGRQMALAEEKGSAARHVLCSAPGGYADEFMVEGPRFMHPQYTAATETLYYTVTRTAAAGESVAGATGVVRFDSPLVSYALLCSPMLTDADGC
jgi:hypothetical protein